MMWFFVCIEIWRVIQTLYFEFGWGNNWAESSTWRRPSSRPHCTAVFVSLIGNQRTERTLPKPQNRIFHGHAPIPRCFGLGRSRAWPWPCEGCAADRRVRWTIQQQQQQQQQNTKNVILICNDVRCIILTQRHEMPPWESRIGTEPGGQRKARSDLELEPHDFVDSLLYLSASPRWIRRVYRVIGRRFCAWWAVLFGLEEFFLLV